MKNKRGVRCPKCGKEMQMQVRCLISAPSSYESQFSKTNLRKKEFYLLACYWDMATFSCECGYCEGRMRGYIKQLEDEIKELKEKLKVKPDEDPYNLF